MKGAKMCDIKRCTDKATIVYLTICAEGHVDEFYLCKEHAVTVWQHEKSCRLAHPIADHMAATLDGHEPEDYRFYPGEWVETKNDKVIKHGTHLEDIINHALNNDHDGTNIWQVTKDHLQTPPE